MSTTLQNFYKSTITRNWTASTGDFNVSVLPTPTSGWLVVSANNSTLREIVYYTAVGTNTYGPYVTVSTRGVGGTTAQTHTIGESVRINVTAELWAEMQADIAGIIASGSPNASTTINGLVEILDTTDVLAGSDTGGSGAKLVPPLSMVGNFSKTVDVSSADILALNSAPLEIIAAPGSGRAIVVDSITYSFTYNSIAYVNGNDVFPVYSGTTTNLFGSGTIGKVTNTLMNGTASFIGRRSYADTNVAILSNTAIELYTATSYITGNSTMKLFINYKVITL